MTQINREYTLLYEALIKTRDEILNKHISQDEIDIDGDEIDLIQGMSIVETNKKLVQRDVNLLNKITVALNKFTNGTYGYCEDCDELIPIKRLQISPHSALCIICKELLEKEQKNSR
jgi:DnaK suppressor protein